jgi:hypothetical protein
MKKKRPRRKPAKPPPRGRSRPERRAGPPAPPGPLEYKVVELSVVDEQTLEHVLNEGVALGWRLDGVQFAMRESSRRPAMAFVLFVCEAGAPSTQADAERRAQARERLAQLAGSTQEPDA